MSEFMQNRAPGKISKHDRCLVEKYVRVVRQNRMNGVGCRRSDTGLEIVDAIDDYVFLVIVEYKADRLANDIVPKLYRINNCSDICSRSADNIWIPLKSDELR